MHTQEGPATTGRRRGTAIVLTAALHAGGLLLLLLPIGAATPARPRMALATFDVPGERVAQSAPRRAPQPRKVIPPPPVETAVPPPLIHLPTLSPVVATMLEQADAQAQTGGCDLTAPVQAALRASIEVQQALPSIPDTRRSVANAIAIWDQAWVQPDDLLKQPALDTIRSTITSTIAAASPACRMQPQAGPRLVYLPDHDQTTVLALGSGQWTWQQVVDSAGPGANVVPTAAQAPEIALATRRTAAPARAAVPINSYFIP